MRPLPESAPGAQLALMDFVAKVFQLREGMIYLSPAPLYHSVLLGNLSGSLRLGATAVIDGRALRSGAVPRPRRALPGHHVAGRADDVPRVS